jgi:hypothetical protein
MTAALSAAACQRAVFDLVETMATMLTQPEAEELCWAVVKRLQHPGGSRVLQGTAVFEAAEPAEAERAYRVYRTGILRHLFIEEVKTLSSSATQALLHEIVDAAFAESNTNG